MDQQFWINRWNEGSTAFHRENYHDKLLQYFPPLNPQEGQRVLVPLCGKTKDLLWLHQLKLKVHGVELSNKAANAFFTENKLSPVAKLQGPDFTDYSFQNITLSCGDFFKLKEIDAYDFIYDRAALVALPASMRKAYAHTIRQALKTAGKYLLITFEYDPAKMEGPPFSIGADEIQALFGENFAIRLMERESPSHEAAKLSSMEGLKQAVYILEKNA